MEHREPGPTSWQLLSSHARVLLAVLDDDQALRSEIAERTDVTERTVSRIINDLEGAGYLVVDRNRRRNRYRLGSRVAELAGVALVRALHERLTPGGDVLLGTADATGTDGAADAAIDERVDGTGHGTGNGTGRRTTLVDSSRRRH